MEDAGDAPLATTPEGRRVGTVGDAAALSFAPDGPLGAGRLGLLATDDPRVAERARLLRSHGMTSGSWSRHSGSLEMYDVVAVGGNHRPDEPQAALALRRWARLGAEVERRRALTRAYRRELGPLAPELRLAFPAAAVRRSSCAGIVALLADAGRREAVRRELADGHGVCTGTLAAAPAAPPVAARLAQSSLLLPLHHHLDRADVVRVAAALERVLSGRASASPARASA